LASSGFSFFHPASKRPDDVQEEGENTKELLEVFKEYVRRGEVFFPGNFFVLYKVLNRFGVMFCFKFPKVVSVFFL